MLKCFLYGLEKESTSLLTVMTELWWYYVGLQVRVREGADKFLVPVI